MQNSLVDGTVLGLDIGDSRIGIARAHTFAKLPEPVTVLDALKNDPFTQIAHLIKDTDAQALIIGLPKLASGSDSDQTLKVRAFVAKLASTISLPMYFVDEAYSSQDADKYIRQQQPKIASNDAIAACVILERYFRFEGVTNV